MADNLISSACPGAWRTTEQRGVLGSSSCVIRVVMLKLLATRSVGVVYSILVYRGPFTPALRMESSVFGCR